MKTLGRKLLRGLLASSILVCASSDCNFLTSTQILSGIGATCSSNNDCHNKLCEESMCTLGCSNDEDCPAPSRCIASRCRMGCKSDGDCSSGQLCDTTNVCRVGCRTDDVCGRGSICDQITATCITGCADDKGCELGNICTQDQCVPGCRDDQSCPLANVCQAGVCKTGCTSNDRCPSGQVCAPTGDGDCSVPTSATCVKACKNALKLTFIATGPTDGSDSAATSVKEGLDAAAVRLGTLHWADSAYNLVQGVSSVADLTRKIDNAIRDGSTVIVTNAARFTSDILSAANRHKDAQFLIMGGSNNGGLTNVGVYRGRTESLWYITGQLGARVAANTAVGQAKCIGIVASHPSKEVVRDINALARGIHAQDRNVELIVRWLGTSRDESAKNGAYSAANFSFQGTSMSREEVLSAQLADLGCRVIATHTDSGGVVSAVENRLKIPFRTSDKFNKQPIFSIASNYRGACRTSTADATWLESCLASAAIDWTSTFTRVLDRIYNRKWQGDPLAPEDLKADAESLLVYEPNPTNAQTGISAADIARVRADFINNVKYAGIFKGIGENLDFTGQRDIDNNGPTIPEQTVLPNLALDAAELDRMCWFVKGIREGSNVGIPTWNRNGDPPFSLVDALVPGPPDVGGKDTKVSQANPRYSDVFEYLVGLNLDPTRDMDCTLQ